MRPRTLKISVSLSGMTAMPIATVTITKFADFLEPDTDLICPQCKTKPTWHGGYDCTCCPKCGKPMERKIVDEKGTVNWKCPEDGYQEPTHFNHWSQLERILKSTGQPILKPKLNEEGKDVLATAYTMDVEEFAKYVDATYMEYGVIVKDEESAGNLRKLLVASEKLSKVVFIRFNDTYEERIAILTTSISDRIILKEIIPLNLADIKETMRIDLSKVSAEEIAEAENFVKMLPKAEEKHFNVADYRTLGIEGKKVSPKVLQLEEILAKTKTAPTQKTSS